MLLAVSDVLVMREYDPLANSLERAGRLARGSLRMRAGEALGLYWEVYGLGPDPETIALSVTLNKVAEGQLGELNEIADRDVNPPLSLMWQETVPAYMPIWGRSLDLSLPSDMSSGLYVLHLMVGAHGREPVHATRAFLVEN